MIFVLALIVRLIAVALFSRAPVNDLLWNDAVGLNLLAGHGFTASQQPPYVPGVFRAPGYPFLLAVLYGAFGHSYTAVYLVQAVLDALTAVLIAATAGRLLGVRIGVASGFLYALYPYPAIFCGILHQDVLLVFVTAVALLLTVRAGEQPQAWGRWIAAGALFGLAALVKPIVIVLAGVPALVALASPLPRMRKLTAAIVVGLAVGAVIAPWVIRNYVHFQAFPPLAVGGTADDLFLLVDEIRHGEDAVTKRAMSVPPSRDSQTYLERFVDGAELIRRDHELARSGWAELAPYWPQYLWLMVKNVPRLWISHYAMQHGPFVSSIAFALSIVFLGLGTLGMITEAGRWRTLLPLYAAIALVTLAYAWHPIEARYSLPARPAMCVFIAALSLRVWDRLRARRASSSVA
jgi:4-amino-4-deoxy-L-arabinose transferase-like glycosyltransferase